MNITPLYQIATRVLRRYQSFLGISTLGARAIILNENNQVLLVQHTYQPHWYIPGGGVKKGESTKAALLRELKEEVGLTLLEEPILFGIYHRYQLKVNDYPVVYVVKKFSLTETYSREIENTGWFDYTALPETTSPGTKRRLSEYFTNQTPSETW
ncbi:NUDIX domain-containing protein [Legionella bononiensis]|uniref:NUDIX domain-containing protein n=1 Tax=Legionella bononiensis TaxID=2793102 RepID=A0ABS1WB92_9GAMM|nr:NUDIX domain-containing protein [Legionella bononiensis]MBL7481507.1 NUDIX domain-containing protein [Legionella bononiensis]MBL7526625.1 NUDIX domain-containing protein [Legionella bononiensis]